MQCFRRVNVHPHGTGIASPNLMREYARARRVFSDEVRESVLMCDGFGILAGFLHGDKIVRDAATGDGGIFAELFMHEADSLCARRGDERVFPNARLGVKDKPVFLKRPDEVAPEVLHADVPVPFLRRREIHAVKRDDASGLDDTVQLFDEKIELLEEFGIVLHVPHVVRAVAVGVERCERRGEDTHADGVVRQRGYHVHAVGVVSGEVLPAFLIDDVHLFLFLSLELS